MKRYVAATLFLATAVCPIASHASASASVQVTGAGIDVAAAVNTNTAEFNYGFFEVDLQPLETVSRSFTYTVTLSDDGLPAFRVDTICTPDHLSDCGPAPTGLEQAYALIEIGRDRRAIDSDNVYLDDSNIVQSFQSITGMPRTYAGTLTYTATDTSEYMSQIARLQLMVYVLADVAPVPEPAPWLPALAGLAFVAHGHRQRCRNRLRA
jgi:hypothetical protein